ncbi:MAG: thioredoxin [Betaproteobacteria bacterium HGW-Betaproteobacteria-21]|nr:MAG: thioredoxin [Betaproteobacteria bacterium HGW-Betaproteobacteria-21]
MSVILPADLLSRGGDACGDRSHLVLIFCAEWCGTCRSFRPVLEMLAAAHQQIGFAWLDIEDDAELAGDIEVESFPTVAILRGSQPLYFGATLPLEDVVARLIRSALSAGGPLVEVPEELGALAARIFAAAAQDG